MRRFLLLLTAAAVVSVAARADAPADDEDKTFYALGLAIAKSLAQYDLSDEELALVQSGMADGLSGEDTDIDLAQFNSRLAALGRQRAAALAEREKAAASAFVGQLAAEEGAQVYESGLVMFELEPGAGASPAATDTVEVHYHGTLRDGTVFDSSVQRGTPATFPLNRVIPCWTEAVQKMQVGGKAKLVCPASIAYGDRGSPPTIPPGAALVFEVELLGVQ